MGFGLFLLFPNGILGSTISSGVTQTSTDMDSSNNSLPIYLKPNYCSCNSWNCFFILVRDESGTSIAVSVPEYFTEPKQ